MENENVWQKNDKNERVVTARELYTLKIICVICVQLIFCRAEPDN
jgi:hypothetical protein